MCAVMLIVACSGGMTMTSEKKVNAAEQATVWVVDDSTVSAFTDTSGDYKTDGSFAHSLYINYVKPA